MRNRSLTLLCSIVAFVVPGNPEIGMAQNHTSTDLELVCDAPENLAGFTLVQSISVSKFSSKTEATTSMERLNLWQASQENYRNYKLVGLAGGCWLSFYGGQVTLSTGILFENLVENTEFFKPTMTVSKLPNLIDCALSSKNTSRSAETNAMMLSLSDLLDFFEGNLSGHGDRQCSGLEAGNSLGEVYYLGTSNSNFGEFVALGAVVGGGLFIEF